MQAFILISESFSAKVRGTLYTFIYSLGLLYQPYGGRTGLVVRASDSGSGDPGSIDGRVSVLFP